MRRKKRNRKVKRYSTDLNDKKWQLLAPLLQLALLGGRPRTVSLRKVINAILYITRSGCAGDCSLTRFHRGRRFMAITVAGQKMAPGSESKQRL